MYGSWKACNATEQNASSKPSHHPYLWLRHVLCIVSQFSIAIARFLFSLSTAERLLAWPLKRAKRSIIALRSWMANSPVVHLYSVLRETFQRTEHSRELMDLRSDSFVFKDVWTAASLISEKKTWPGFMKAQRTVLRSGSFHTLSAFKYIRSGSWRSLKKMSWESQLEMWCKGQGSKIVSEESLLVTPRVEVLLLCSAQGVWKSPRMAKVKD